MHDVNWDMVQFKYEFLGFSLANLAAEHSISTAVLEYNSRNWKKISLEQDDPIDMSEIKSIDDVLNKLSKQIINQTQAFSILKQKFLNPKFIELESILLHKAISIASNLDEKGTQSSSVLKNLVEVLTNLLNQNPLLKPENNSSDEDSDKTWEIKIVGPTESPKRDPAKREEGI
jgi:hypothetical protein